MTDTAMMQAREAIDWTQPLEMIDGTPVRLETDAELYGAFGGTNPDRDGHYWVRPETGERPDLHALCVLPDGTQDDDEQLVRNRPDTPSEARTPDVIRAVDEATALRGEVG